MSNWWLKHKFRMIQNNLRDIDAAMDVDEEIRMLKQFHANVVQVGCGGITAFSDTQLDFQKRSPWLSGDKFGELITKCHENGIRVIGRFDVSKVDQDFEAVHPEWLLRNDRGEHIYYNRTVVTCLNSDYQQKRTPEMLQEVLRKYPLDGIFFNMFGYQTNDYDGHYFGICRCENCKRRFRKLFGGDLELVEDPAHAAVRDGSSEVAQEAWKKYQDFKKYTVNEILEKIRAAIHEVRPETILSTYCDHGVDVIRTETNTAVDRPLPMWIYSASDNVSSIENTFEDKVSSNVGINAVDIPYRFMGVSDTFNRIRLYENIANRGNLDWCIIGAFPDYPDRSNYAGTEEVFRFAETYEAMYSELRPLGNVILLNPGSPYSGGVTDEYRGVFKALKHSHVMFDTVIDTDCEHPAIDIASADVIIIPGIRKLKSVMLRNILSEFDGKVLLTAGALVEEPELLERFCGVRELEERPVVRGGYFETTPKQVFRSFPEQDWIYVDKKRWGAAEGGAATAGAAVQTAPQMAVAVLPYIKEAPYGPPERCYGHERTEESGVILTERGAAILFEMGLLYFRQGYDVFRKVFMDVLTHLTEPTTGGGQQKICLAPFTTNAHRSVEILMSRLGDDAFEMELINLSGFDGVTVGEPVKQYQISFEFEELVESVEELGLEGPRPVEHTEHGFVVPELGLHRAYVIRNRD